MQYQAYKVVKTHAHEIPGWKITSRLIYVYGPNIIGTNGDVQYDLSTLALSNGEQLEGVNITILILHQEIILYV